MTLEAVERAVASHGLFVMGGWHPGPEDEVGTLLLIGTGPGMWPCFKTSVEYADGGSDPLDRWSKRVARDVWETLGRADISFSFPSDGPPYAPFIDWALRTGRFWTSPVGMLVHDTAGLWVSIRMALHLPEVVGPLPPARRNPCTPCARPCATACPVDALKGETYDVSACKDHVTSEAGRDCLETGCRARRICPVSRAFGRDPEQSAFHMEAFI